MIPEVKNLSNATQKLDAISVKINRLNAKKAALKTTENWKDKSARRARTRTLIQMGGLINLVGLSELCNIIVGEDLQKDLEAMDKSAVLLGILEETISALPPALTDEQITYFKTKGIRRLKMNHLMV